MLKLTRCVKIANVKKSRTQKKCLEFFNIGLPIFFLDARFRIAHAFPGTKEKYVGPPVAGAGGGAGARWPARGRKRLGPKGQLLAVYYSRPKIERKNLLLRGPKKTSRPRCAGKSRECHKMRQEGRKMPIAHLSAHFAQEVARSILAGVSKSPQEASGLISTLISTPSGTYQHTFLLYGAWNFAHSPQTILRTTSGNLVRRTRMRSKRFYPHSAPLTPKSCLRAIQSHSRASAGLLEPGSLLQILQAFSRTFFTHANDFFEEVFSDFSTYHAAIF